MRYRNGPCTILVMAAFLVSLASPLLAATSSVDQDSRWAHEQNKFSAFGVVESIDTTEGEITVTLEGTSRLLRDNNGSSFVFKIQDTVRVKTFGGAMGKGGIMVGGKMGHHGGRFTLDDIQSKDNVMLTGSFDPVANTYTVKTIVIWLF